MGSIAPVNPDLKGHKLLLLYRREPKQEIIDRLKKKHPGLEIVFHSVRDPSAEIPADIWDGVTLLLTFKTFPPPGKAHNLQYVQLTSAGANQVLEVPLYKDTDIPFCTANGVHPPQIAEWVIGTYLAFQHRIPLFLKAAQEENWIRGVTEEDDDSVGKRIGILGYGTIGRQVARIGKALGAEVYAYTLHERPTRESRRDESYTIPGTGDPEGLLPSKWFHGTSIEAVNHFLAQDLDLLVIGLPLTKATHQIISAPQFEILSKKKTFISNIARGAHINTDALVKALETGQISGAALDVTDPEPLPKGHPLWKAPNLILTPHSSGHSKHYTDRVLAIVEHNLGQLSQGLPLVNKVDRALSY